MIDTLKEERIKFTQNITIILDAECIMISEYRYIHLKLGWKKSDFDTIEDYYVDILTNMLSERYKYDHIIDSKLYKRY